MPQVKERPKFGCFVVANIISFFLGFVVIALGIIAYVNWHQTKQDQLNDFESELGDFDPRGFKTRIEFIGAAGNSIGVATDLLQIDPKNVDGYEALISCLNALGATTEAKRQYNIAIKKGVMLPPFNSDTFQYPVPPN